MSIAIMQPYTFPYIGYFQLIHASDVFVFYDDVNFINRGWINRNRILLNGKDHLFTIPCSDASQNKLINEVALQDDEKAIQKLLSTFKQAYSKAPYFKDVYSMLEDTLLAGSKTIAALAIKSVTNICKYLELERTLKISSEEYDNRELKKADRLIDICHREGITHYINAAGGKEIYTKEYFGERGISLNFLNSVKQEYKQFNNPFVPWLSVIDVLMFNTKEDIVDRILPAYTLE
jgi:hypothetical protein